MAKEIKKKPGRTLRRVIRIILLTIIITVIIWKLKPKAPDDVHNGPPDEIHFPAAAHKIEDSRNPVKGLAMPPGLNDKSQLVFEYLGNNFTNFSVGDLKSHIEFFSLISCGNYEKRGALAFQIINGRLYPSMTFTDLYSHTPVGDLDYTTWRTKLKSAYDLVDDGRTFEVTDSNGIVLLSVKFTGVNKINVSGTFVFDTNIFIMGNTPSLGCISLTDPNWKSKMINKVKETGLQR